MKKLLELLNIDIFKKYFDFLLHISKENSQIIKFIIAGGTGAVLEIALFILFNETFGIHYLISNLVAITTAIYVNYLISQKWVFESGRYSKGMELVAFVGISILIIGLNQLVMWAFVDGLDINERISKVTSICIVAVVNFFGKKYLVFKN
ncbi:GtrA family protein [Flexithrix dorotheae]|uniref:GtrA family protein n=1 Tax=Flexithrix dorotheae TaxID=70993 RepID=UPI00037F4A36|nr:GtrA family protein [Flexithrix dorotheae]